jgi:hypothetical protein
MSQEAEMAAKWKMFEDYKALESKLSVLEREANALSLALHNVAQVLGGSTRNARVVSDKVIAVPTGSTSGARLQNVDLSGLDPDRIFALISNIETTAKQKTELAAKLRELGMSLP